MPIIRLDGDGVRISSADFWSRTQAYGLCAATALNRAHSSDAAHLMGVDRLAPVRAERGLEHRVHLHRHHHAAGELVRMVHAHLGAEHARRGDLIGLLVPLERGVGAPRAHARTPRLSAHQDRAIEVARLDLGRGPVDE